MPLADPPLPPPAQPTVTQPTIVPPVIAQPPVSAPAPSAPTPQPGGDDPAPPTTPSPPDSPETLAPGSPAYVLRNNPEDGIHLHPTRGERAHVNTLMESQGWKFATVLWQTDLMAGGDGEDRNKIALHPRKNVLLYVRPGATGLIEDVSDPSITHMRLAKHPTAYCSEMYRHKHRQ